MGTIQILSMVAEYALKYGPEVYKLIDEIANLDEVTDEAVAKLVDLKDPESYFKK